MNAFPTKSFTFSFSEYDCTSLNYFSVMPIIVPSMSNNIYS